MECAENLGLERREEARRGTQRVLHSFSLPHDPRVEDVRALGNFARNAELDRPLTRVERVSAERVDFESRARGGSKAKQLAPEIHGKDRADSERSSGAAAHKVIVAARPVSEKQREVHDSNSFSGGSGSSSAL